MYYFKFITCYFYATKTKDIEKIPHVHLKMCFYSVSHCAVLVNSVVYDILNI